VRRSSKPFGAACRHFAIGAGQRFRIWLDHSEEVASATTARLRFNATQIKEATHDSAYYSRVTRGRLINRLEAEHKKMLAVTRSSCDLRLPARLWATASR
jgi:hypothetical protein